MVREVFIKLVVSLDRRSKYLEGIFFFVLEIIEYFFRGLGIVLVFYMILFLGSLGD